MNSCIFCKIVNKEIPAEIVYEDAEVVVFKDINPQAPLHLLLVPRQHISNINEISDSNAGVISKIFCVAKQLALKFGVAESGYRIVVNTSKDAGQEVFHIHFHFLAGRKFSWPPG